MCNKLNVIVLLLALLVFYCPPAMAKCTGTSTVDMSGCKMEAFGKADAALKKLYNRMIVQAKAKDADNPSPSDPDGYEISLTEAQKAWLAFRESECKLRTVGSVGASMRQIEYPECELQMTRARIKELQRYSQDF